MFKMEIDKADKNTDLGTKITFSRTENGETKKIHIFIPFDK